MFLQPYWPSPGPALPHPRLCSAPPFPFPPFPSPSPPLPEGRALLRVVGTLKPPPQPKVHTTSVLGARDGGPTLAGFRRPLGFSEAPTTLSPFPSFVHWQRVGGHRAGPDLPPPPPPRKQRPHACPSLLPSLLQPCLADHKGSFPPRHLVIPKTLPHCCPQSTPRGAGFFTCYCHLLLPVLDTHARREL